MKDSTGKEIITVTELVARTYRGEQVTVNAGHGPQVIKRLSDGCYSVDGEDHHTLEGLREWLGHYHAEFGSAVFFPG